MNPNQVTLSTIPPLTGVSFPFLFFSLFYSGYFLACVPVQHKNTYNLSILPCVPFPSPEDLPDSRGRIHILAGGFFLPLIHLGSPQCSIVLSISLFPKHLVHNCKSGFFQVRTGEICYIRKQGCHSH